MDQVIVDILREAPGKLALVQAWIEQKLADAVYSEQNKDSLREWQAIMETQGVDGVLQVLNDSSEEAERLRQSAPFAMLMPERKRRAILDKYEPLRTRASLAGV